MANRQTIDHFLVRAAKDLEHLKNDAERLGNGELSAFVHLIDMALVEAREQQGKDPGQ